MAIAPKNSDWEIVPLPDGTYPNEQVTHCLLMGISDLLKTIKKVANHLHHRLHHQRRARATGRNPESSMSTEF